MNNRFNLFVVAPRTRCTLAFTVLCLLAGCDSTSLPSMDMQWTTMSSPTARVKSVELLEQTEQGAKMRVVVELANPNSAAIPMLVSNIVFSLDGGGRFEFKDTVNRTIPAHGRQEMAIPVAVATGGRDVTGIGYAVRGSVTYQLPGEMPKIWADSGFPLPAASFTEQGRL